MIPNVLTARITLKKRLRQGKRAGGLAKLEADTGAKLMASAGDRHALETGVYLGWESRHEFDFPPVKVDRILKDGDTIRLGGVTLTARLTPGHTAGATTYLMPVEQNNHHPK